MRKNFINLKTLLLAPAIAGVATLGLYSCGDDETAADPSLYGPIVELDCSTDGPTVSMSASATEFNCSVSSIDITLNLGPDEEALWSNGETGSFEATSAGTYDVTVYNNDGECEATSSVTLSSSSSVPTAAITSASTELDCEDNPVTLSAGSATGVTYEWSNAATTASIDVTTADSYTVTVTNTASGCTASASVAVTAPKCPGYGTCYFNDDFVQTAEYGSATGEGVYWFTDETAPDAYTLTRSGNGVLKVDFDNEGADPGANGVLEEGGDDVNGRAFPVIGLGFGDAAGGGPVTIDISDDKVFDFSVNNKTASDVTLIFQIEDVNGKKIEFINPTYNTFNATYDKGGKGDGSSWSDQKKKIRKYLPASTDNINFSIDLTDGWMDNGGNCSSAAVCPAHKVAGDDNVNFDYTQVAKVIVIMGGSDTVQSCNYVPCALSGTVEFNSIKMGCF